ncbi:MAG: TMEM175 family protein [Bacteroidota bacterium]|nr:TMEM175 family protein [Bacteroidota bacterium]
MSIPVSGETNKRFQLERMILFSDAVFAIAITLLVIELKVPEINGPVSEEKILNALLFISPKFIGFLVSFFLIGLYWTVHHRLFGYLNGYTPKLLWINLFFLLGIVLMPFSTSLYSQYIFDYLETPVIFYTANVCFLGMMNFFLWRYICNKKNQISIPIPPGISVYYSFRALSVPVIFIFTLIVYLFKPRYAILIPPFIPVIMNIATRRFRKKLGVK